MGQDTARRRHVKKIFDVQTLGQALKLPPVPALPTQRNRCGFAATLQNRRTSQGIRR